MPTVLPSSSPMTVQSVKFLTRSTCAGISATMRPRRVTMNRCPTSASAGCRTMATWAPLWTPTPFSTISRAIVVCCETTKEFGILDAPSTHALRQRTISSSGLPELPQPTFSRRAISLLLAAVTHPTNAALTMLFIPCGRKSGQITLSFTVLRFTKKRCADGTTLCAISVSHFWAGHFFARFTEVCPGIATVSPRSRVAN